MRKDIGIWLHMNTFNAYDLTSTQAITVSTSDSISFQGVYDQINDIRRVVNENTYRIDRLENDVVLLRQDVEFLRSVCEIVGASLDAVKRTLDELGIPNINDLI